VVCNASFVVGNVRSEVKGASYALGFMNITPNIMISAKEVGFVQVFIVAVNETRARVHVRLEIFAFFYIVL